MSSRNRTNIEKEQFYSSLHSIFEEVIYPNIRDDIHKLLKFSMMITPFNAGETFVKDSYLRYNVDDNGYPMIYKANNTHVAQLNIVPGDQHSENLYTLQGYYNGYRLWSEPSGPMSSYSLDQIIPVMENITYDAVTYAKGTTVYKDNYIITPENTVYQVVPNQIVMNTDAVPFTNTTVYSPVPDAVVVSPTSISISGYGWFKSKKDDNRFEPVDGSEVWERVSEPV